MATSQNGQERVEGGYGLSLHPGRRDRPRADLWRLVKSGPIGLAR